MTLETLSTTHNWNLPTVCPVCGEPLVLSENHKQLSCSNAFCSSRSSGTIAKWCEKMKIMEMGLTTIEKIQEYGYFMSISSMYDQIDNPDVNKTMKNEFGKVWSNIKKQIQSHMECTLAQFISGYNIPGVGEKQVQKIMDNLNLKEFNDFFLTDNPCRFICDGIGEIISTKLHEGLSKNRDDMVKTLTAVTVLVPKTVNTDSKLGGKSFCFTGAMEYKRAVLQGYVDREGGVNKDTVGKGLDYLVMADPNSTSSKAVKARSLGITIISPEEFLVMVGEK